MQGRKKTGDRWRVAGGPGGEGREQRRIGCRRGERKPEDQGGDRTVDTPSSDGDPLAVIEPRRDEAADDNHMPSFLTRPTPAVAADEAEDAKRKADKEAAAKTS